MLSSSLYTKIKLFKTSSPEKLLWLHNAVYAKKLYSYCLIINKIRKVYVSFLKKDNTEKITKSFEHATNQINRKGSDYYGSIYSV